MVLRGPFSLGYGTRFWIPVARQLVTIEFAVIVRPVYLLQETTVALTGAGTAETVYEAKLQATVVYFDDKPQL